MPTGRDLNFLTVLRQPGTAFSSIKGLSGAFSAYLPTPTIRVMPIASTTSRRWSSHASSTGSISPVTSGDVLTRSPSRTVAMVRNKQLSKRDFWFVHLFHQVPEASRNLLPFNPCPKRAVGWAVGGVAVCRAEFEGSSCHRVHQTVPVCASARAGFIPRKGGCTRPPHRSMNCA